MRVTNAENKFSTVHRTFTLTIFNLSKHFLDSKAKGNILKGSEIQHMAPTKRLCLRFSDPRRVAWFSLL